MTTFIPTARNACSRYRKGVKYPQKSRRLPYPICKSFLPHCIAEANFASSSVRRSRASWYERMTRPENPPKIGDSRHLAPLPRVTHSFFSKTAMSRQMFASLVLTATASSLLVSPEMWLSQSRRTISKTRSWLFGFSIEHPVPKAVAEAHEPSPFAPLPQVLKPDGYVANKSRHGSLRL